MEIAGNVSKPKKGLFKSRKSRDALKCYGLLSTQLIGLVLFSFYPIFWSLKWALYYYTGIPSQTRFVGITNFITLFTQDAKYFHSWLTTLQFTFIKLPIEFIIAFLLALLVNSKLIRGKTFFRSVYFFPTVVSASIIAVIFSNLFDYFGFINAMLEKLNIGAVDWLSTKWKAMTFMVIANVWANLGTNVVYLVAALQNVPNDVYEAAEIDGASKLTVIFRITLPMIAPVLSTVLLLGINGTLHTGEFILLLTNGAPGGESLTVMAHILNSYIPGFALDNVNIGYGAALSLITSLIMCAVGLGYMKLSNKINNIF